MDNFEKLEKSSFKRDYVEMCIRQECAQFKPLKLRPVKHNYQYFCHFGKHDFCRLPYSYSRFEDKLDVSKFKSGLFCRFVELLAPLTLYHFMQSSKPLYYLSLDLRGLEYSDIWIKQKPLSWFPAEFNGIARVHGYSGMRAGVILDSKWRHYQVCYGILRADPLVNLDFILGLNFYKQHRVLELRHLPSAPLDSVKELCAKLFHPKLRHATVSLQKSSGSRHEYTLQQIECLLGYCKDLTHFEFNGADGSLEQPEEYFQNDPNLSQLKVLVERWAVGLTRMEVCVFLLGKLAFQLHGGRLKQCVVKDNKWFWTETFHINDGRYRNYSVMGFDMLLPFFMRWGYHRDVLNHFAMKKLFNLPNQLWPPEYNCRSKFRRAYDTVTCPIKNVWFNLTLYIRYYYLVFNKRG